jgi:hypothetical protein
MLKKLFITASAAAAVSVPLAGVAWAAPSSDAGSNSNGVGKGGVPAAAGEALHNNYPALYSGAPVTPGSVFSGAAQAKPPGTSLPDAYGASLTGLFNTAGLPNVFPSGSAPAVPPPAGTTYSVGPTVPGSVVKLFTPACAKANGKQATVTITTNGQTTTETAGCAAS